MTVSIVKPFKYESAYYGSTEKSKFINEKYKPDDNYWDRLLYTAEHYDLFLITPMLCGETARWKGNFPVATVFYNKLYKNPIIVEESGDQILLQEASLSDKDFTVSVYRPNTITVEYLDEDNKFQTTSFNGLSARYFLQANQLMFGIHLIECAKPLAQKYALKRYQKKYGKHFIN